MSLKDAINPKQKISQQLGGPRDVLKGLNESFQRSFKGGRENAQPSSLHQPCIFFTKYVPRLFRKPLAITLPFYSDSVFLREEDALAFVPYFVKRLVEKGLIPPESIKQDGSIDPEIIEPGLAKLTMAFAERNI